MDEAVLQIRGKKFNVPRLETGSPCRAAPFPRFGTTIQRRPSNSVYPTASSCINSSSTSSTAKSM
jgi:hypothetical protein